MPPRKINQTESRNHKQNINHFQKDDTNLLKHALLYKTLIVLALLKVLVRTDNLFVFEKIDA